MKKENGITLVALIITIIVLLILAVVTIRAVNEGSLFNHANNAVTEYDKAVKKENTLISKYLSELGKHDGGETGEVNEFLVNYFLGADRSGKDFYSLVSGGFVFNDDPETEDINESNVIQYVYFDMSLDIVEAGYVGFYIRYDDKIYMVKLVSDGNNGTMTAKYSDNNPVPLVYAPQGREGQIVQYDSNNDSTNEDWMIITDRNGLVEIVSTVPMGELTLGKSDTMAISSVTSDINGDGTIDNIDYSMYSYNNAITRINNYCKSLITSTTNVRSIGAASDTSGNYNPSELFNTWYTGTNGNNIKNADNNHLEDQLKLLFFNIDNVGSMSWFASRFIMESNGSVVKQIDFCIHLTGGSSTSGNSLWSAEPNGVVRANEHTYAVRPVIINPNGI